MAGATGFAGVVAAGSFAGAAGFAAGGGAGTGAAAAMAGSMDAAAISLIKVMGEFNEISWHNGRRRARVARLLMNRVILSNDGSQAILNPCAQILTFSESLLTAATEPRLSAPAGRSPNSETMLAGRNAASYQRMRMYPPAEPAAPAPDERRTGRTRNRE